MARFFKDMLPKWLRKPVTDDGAEEDSDSDSQPEVGESPLAEESPDDVPNPPEPKDMPESRTTPEFEIQSELPPNLRPESELDLSSVQSDDSLPEDSPPDLSEPDLDPVIAKHLSPETAANDLDFTPLDPENVAENTPFSFGPAVEGTPLPTATNELLAQRMGEQDDAELKETLAAQTQQQEKERESIAEELPEEEPADPLPPPGPNVNQARESAGRNAPYLPGPPQQQAFNQPAAPPPVAGGQGPEGGEELLRAVTAMSEALERIVTLTEIGNKALEEIQKGLKDQGFGP